MELSQGSKSLQDLVKKAFNGEVMLPDFQRNFVWTRGDVEELFKSLLENMFIGSFLIHNVDPLNPPFKTIEIAGAKDVNKEFVGKPNILILDGQQRLSSVFYALYEPNIPLKNVKNPYSFFINIQSLLNDDIESSVFSWSKKSREYKSVFDFEKKDYINTRLLEEQIIPMSLLIGDFTEVWYGVFKQHYSTEDGSKIRAYVKNVMDYKVLTLDVPLGEKPANIAVLFERINRTGVKLSIFDLLVARLYKYLNLREKWETLFDKENIIQKYALDKRNNQIPHYFLQSLALKNGLSIKSRDMLKIDEKIINNENWDLLSKTVTENVLPRLLDISEYGIADPQKWLPYSPMIIPYLGFFLNEKIDTDKIDTWYWSAVFFERYAGSTESKITKDYKEVIAWMKNDKKIPSIVKEINESIEKDNYYNLTEVAYSNNSIYKGVFNLLFMNGAKDFYMNDKIKFKSKSLDDHHIFPKKFLESKEVTEYINGVTNRTLIHAKTNRKISKKSPQRYLTEMLKIYDNDKSKVLSILEKHFISEEMFELMMEVSESSSKDLVAEKFNKFIDLRERLILEAIKNKVVHSPLIKKTTV